jgi:hypothetical protein
MNINPYWVNKKNFIVHLYYERFQFINETITFLGE